MLTHKKYTKVHTHINPESKIYYTTYMREKRNKTLTYFKKWNRWRVQGKDIEEDKIFNYTDLYYIKTMSNRIAR